MAFPDSITIFTRAQDPSTATDMNNITEYQRLLANGDFAAASSFLQNMAKGIEMNLNASRFNEVLEVINEIETFYLGLNGVKAYINENINAFADNALYNQTTNYSIGNIASNGSKWFKAIQANGPDTTVVEPEITSNWENYWEYFLIPQPAKQYPIQSEQPTGQNVGDLWFKVIN